ncbi:kinase-like domain-containing protein [Phellopilus nigrolimitatus]|nr:kinase-like domain-containing protein [Phellopilus nigrolimitatus]
MLLTLLRNIFRRIWLLLPSKLRLFAYHRLIAIGLRLYGRTTSTRTFRLPFNLYAKFGKNIRKSEAEVMHFVAQNTTVPVPSVVDCIEVRTGAFIVMTGLPGKQIRGELRFMTPDEKALFTRDLGKCLQQLHAITAPDSRVSAFGGGPFQDFRIDHEGNLGPFATEEAFHKSLYRNMLPEEWPRIKELARDVHGTSHRLCLTHNDLSPTNILIENNRLSGLVDWECAAWLPEYWEYSKSMYCRTEAKEWIEAMKMAHPQNYQREYEVEYEFWCVSCPW